MNSYKDLTVWQKSIDLVLVIYKLTTDFPKDEVYGLSQQMRRAAVSIASNIAEGSKRSTRKDFKHFLLISLGSGAELETQIEIAKKLLYSTTTSYNNIDSLLNEIMRMLSSLKNKLS